jgi:hypothetical protein
LKTYQSKYPVIWEVGTYLSVPTLKPTTLEQSPHGEVIKLTWAQESWYPLFPSEWRWCESLLEESVKFGCIWGVNSVAHLTSGFGIFCWPTPRDSLWDPRIILLLLLKAGAIWNQSPTLTSLIAWGGILVTVPSHRWNYHCSTSFCDWYYSRLYDEAVLPQGIGEILAKLTISILRCFLPILAIVQRLFSLLVNPIDSAIGWPLHTVFFVNGSSSWRSRSQILLYRLICLDHRGVVGTGSLFNLLLYASSLYESSCYWTCLPFLLKWSVLFAADSWSVFYLNPTTVLAWLLL